MQSTTKKESIRRLKIIEGHVKKVCDMIEEEKYCPDILQQTSAVSSALKKVDELILDSHLHTCVIPSFKGSKSEKSIKELLEVFKRR